MGGRGGPGRCPCWGLVYRTPTGRRVTSSTELLRLIERLQAETVCRRGIEVTNLEPAVREALVLEEGVLIEYVHHDAFAPQPSLSAGDILVGWAGQRVQSAAQFRELYDAQTPGELVPYRVLRRRRRISGGTIMPGRDCLPVEPPRPAAGRARPRARVGAGGAGRSGRWGRAGGSRSWRRVRPPRPASRRATGSSRSAGGSSEPRTTGTRSRPPRTVPSPCCWSFGAVIGPGWWLSGRRPLLPGTGRGSGRRRARHHLRRTLEAVRLAVDARPALQGAERTPAPRRGECYGCSDVIMIVLSTVSSAGSSASPTGKSFLCSI